MAAPDRSPSSQRPVVAHTQMVSTLEEALALERPMQGSWEPSPPGRSRSPTEWASPAPRSCAGTVGGYQADGDVDFDLVIDGDLGIANGPSLAAQIDTDMPTYRLVDGNKAFARQRSQFEVEQLVASPGTLPVPMTADERENAIRRLLPTSTYQLLAKVPRELLTAADEKGQALRRQLSRGATVVFVSAGLSGKRFTFERAAALGIKCVVLEHPDSWAASLVDEGIIAKFLPVDMSQSSEWVFDEALRLIRQLGEDGKTGAVDGIATFVELSVPLVARLCEALGLPGHRPAAVDSARNKHMTRAALRAAGLPFPRNALIRSAAEVDRAAEEVGFPAVLKPVSGAASLGVKKVNNLNELRLYYVEVVAELKTLVISGGALIKGTGTGGVEADKMIDLTVLLEQFLDGVEVDVDVVMSDGEWRYAAVADNGPTLEPYFNETWAVCPSLLPKDQQVGLKDLAVSCVKSLGFTSGVFHVECKWTSTGPQLIEVNARMGGGQIHECNLRTWGVDLVEETLFAALGIPSRPKVPAKPFAAVAYCYVNAVKSGKVVDVRGLEALRKLTDVIWAKPLVRLGAEVVGPEAGMPTWLCDLLVTGPSAKEALKFLKDREAEEPVKVV